MTRIPIGEASVSQQKTLAIVPKVVSLLSVLSSLYIVVDVVKLQASKRSKLYHRILVCMSGFDAVSSLAWFFTTWPIPADVLPAWGAQGTQQTCSAQGFFTQLSVATVLYNGSLALYYYLVIRCGWSEKRLETAKVEVWMHTLPWLFGIGTSVAALWMGLLNPIGWDCWIAGVPLGCEGDDCTRGSNYNLYQWLFFYGPLWLVISSVSVVMGLILYQFRFAERANKKYVVKDTSTANSQQADKKKRKKQKKGTSRSREIARQCLFYVGSFYVTWTFPTILRITELTAQDVYFHFVMLSATFVPIQGVLNLIVYLRPRYVQIRKKKKQKKVLKERRRKQQQERQTQLEEEIRTTTANVEETAVSMEDEHKPKEEEATIPTTNIHARFPPSAANRPGIQSLRQISSFVVHKAVSVRDLMQDVKEVLADGDGGAGGQTMNRSETSIYLSSLYEVDDEEEDDDDDDYDDLDSSSKDVDCENNDEKPTSHSSSEEKNARGKDSGSELYSW